MNEKLPQEYDQIINSANNEVFVEIIGPRTGNTFLMREATYGVLDSDPHSPLSCVSVANSSLSIDLWKGCAWQCSYCHVQGGLQDLNPETLTMPKRAEARSIFSYDQVVDSLIEHPFFEDDKSVISVGTASTEPFAAGDVADSTFDIMEYFVTKGLKNPFWIVTKAGFPNSPDYAERLKSIVDNGNNVMISICWANNPKNVEPVQTNRFRNIEKIKGAGASVGWYLRPLADSWSTAPEVLQQSFETVQKYAPYIDMIVPGGLRWTEGIVYGVEEIRDQKMPDIPKNDNIKELSDETWQLIDDLCAEYFPGTPVLRKSSCSLSNMLKIPNHNLVQYQNVEECTNSVCPSDQRDVCRSYNIPTKDELQVRLSRIGLGTQVAITEVNSINGKFVSEPPAENMTFALRHMIEIQAARE